jgi:uncharacterized membrane protein
MRFRHITRYFVRGALIIVPFALTIYSLYFVFITIDRLLPFDFPGLGLLVTFVTVTLVGFLSSNVIGSTFVGLGEQMLRKVPERSVASTSRFRLRSLPTVRSRRLGSSHGVT